jgi:cellulose biosynthesis protein BcsS
MRTIRLLLAALGALATLSVHAEAVGLAGVEIGRNASYGFLGYLAPLTAERLGQGWVGRLWADYQTYQYDSNGTIKARAGSVAAAAGYQLSGDSWGLGTYAGLLLGHTRLAPDDPGNPNRGTHTRFQVQVDADKRFGNDWRVSEVFSYVAGARSYYARLRLLAPLSPRLGIGPEIAWKGSPDYHAYQAGFVVSGIEPAPRTALNLRFGAARQVGVPTSAYGAVELVRVF